MGGRFGPHLERGQTTGTRDHPANRSLLAPLGMPGDAVPARLPVPLIVIAEDRKTTG